MQKRYESQLSSFETHLTASGVPDRLHHYTSLYSLIGIVDQKEIWFTNIDYLNDISEFREGKELFLEILARAESKFELPESYTRIRCYIEECITPYDLFSFSVSERRDSLEQWRAYANAESGVMITFHGIFEHLEEAGITCMKVVYDEKHYTEEIHRLVEKMKRWDLARLNGNLAGFWAKFHRVMAKLFLKKKNSAFKHEEEWKLFYSHRDIDDSDKIGTEVVKEKIRFRPAENYIIPYSILDLTKLRVFDRSRFIQEVLVSPTIKQREKGQSRSIEGIKRLLAKNDIERFSEIVDFSLLPYR
jgi:hypothetical protein